MTHRWRRRVAALLAVVAPSLHAQAPTPTDQHTNEGSRAWLRELLVPSPYKLSASARHATIEYRVSLSTLSWVWPRTGEQQVAAADKTVLLRVCRTCGDEAPPTPDELRRYLSENAYVDSDARTIRAFARVHSRGRTTEQRMQALSVAVRDHMTGPITFSAYLSASEALAQRRGDCTESAVLLAALARARGIPARVVSGIAYSSRFTGESHVFSPHMWAQAWNGTRWISYDAGLGAFDAGHIALHVGDGDPARMPELLEAIRRLRIVDAYTPVTAPSAGAGDRPSPAARSSSVPST